MTCGMRTCTCLLVQVSGDKIKELQRGERELVKLKGQLRARMDFLDLAE